MGELNLDELDRWMKSLEHLPDFMRDFHDQKDLFKSIEILYGDNGQEGVRDISWVDAHIYTVDRFLWYMASRGYTLQRSRKKVRFKPLLDHYDFSRPKMKQLILGDDEDGNT